MKELNSVTLVEALDFCNASRRANVGIILTCRKTVDELLDTFHEQIKAGHMDGWQVCRSFAGGAIRAPSGGMIHVLSEDRTIKSSGCSFNMVLYEPGIDHSVMAWLFSKQEVPLFSRNPVDDFLARYMSRPFVPQEPAVSEELDEFLNSFKII